MTIRADAGRYTREHPKHGAKFVLDAEDFLAQPVPKDVDEYQQRQAAAIELQRSWAKAVGQNTRRGYL
jgi:hypothetical protein